VYNWNLKKKNQNLLLKKKNNQKQTSKIRENYKICKTAILYYIKNVCVCRFCHTVSTLLLLLFPSQNLWKCQICKQKKTFVNKQLKFEKVNKFVETTIYITYFL